MKVEFEQQDEEVVLALIKKLSVIGGADLVELQYYWGNLNYNSFNDDVQNWLYCLAKHNYKLGLTEAEYFRIGMTLYYDFMQRFEYPSGGVNEYFSEAVPFNGFLAIKQLKCGTFVFDAVGVRYENDLAPVKGFVVFNVEMNNGDMKGGLRVNDAPQKILWPVMFA